MIRRYVPAWWPSWRVTLAVALWTLAARNGLVAVASLLLRGPFHVSTLLSTAVAALMGGLAVKTSQWINNRHAPDRAPVDPSTDTRQATGVYHETQP